MNSTAGSRGRTWFQALTGVSTSTGKPASVLEATAPLGGSDAMFLCVVPNPNGRFPRAREGQVGLEEGYALASYVRTALEQDRDTPRTGKRPILAIVDVTSQAYGRREETAGIFQAAAAAADAYASARMAGHPVIALLVGQAFSGGFLTHGYQANRILAFDDDGVTVHAMHKEAAARITRRTVADLDELGQRIPPMSYSIREYSRLGLLHRLLHVDDPRAPSAADVQMVSAALLEAIDDTRRGAGDLSMRYKSPEALASRRAGNAVRALMEAQWLTPERDR